MILQEHFQHDTGDLCNKRPLELNAVVDRSESKAPSPLKSQSEASLKEHQILKSSPDVSTFKNHKLSKSSRYIPGELKRAVFHRDQGKCQYVDIVTQNKCDSKHLMQIDHRFPVSKGGKNTLENLQLLCAAHNQLKGANV